MEKLTLATLDDLIKVRDFYWTLTSSPQCRTYTPAWISGVNPSQAMLRESIERKELYFLANEEGEIDAALILDSRPSADTEDVEWTTGAKDGEFLVLHKLGVRTGVLKRGIGHHMVSEAIRIASEKGMKALRLETRPTNAPALHLYKAHGFVEVCNKTLTLPVGNGYFTLMERPLQALNTKASRS